MWINMFSKYTTGKAGFYMSDYEEKSMVHVFMNQVSKLGDRACVAYKKDGEFRDISWNRMNEMVRLTASFLIQKGIQKGDRISIFSPNRYEWWVADLASLSIGAADVPVYATNSAEEAKYVLGHSSARGCFVGTREQLERVLKVKPELPKLEFIVVFDPTGTDDPNVLTFSGALEKGREHDHSEEFEKRIRAIEPNDLATIIYTSGTTGPPKGVMLSHNNFRANVDQALEDFRHLLGVDDVMLSFLPLSHALERTAGLYMAIEIGGKVAFAEDFTKIQDNLQEIRPTLIISVPRLYEKIHSGIISKVADAPALKKAMFNFAVNTAGENLPYVCEAKEPKGWLGFKYGIANKLVYSKLKDKLGMDRIRFAVSGGGPLSVSDAEFFLGMGIVILEGYGLTETTPITNVNRLGKIKPGSVGAAVKDTEIRIADDGEVQIKGPQVMLGYYRDEEATRSVFTEDGFFKTGDVGEIDEKGRLKITDRIKEIIVTSGGKNISPANIENVLKGSRFIEQVAVIGDRRKYLSALIVPTFEEIEKWAKDNGINFSSMDDLTGNEQVMALFNSEIEHLMSQFARAEQIRKFRLMPAEWTQDTGELTPTLKLKRRIIEKKYAEFIESLYPPEA